MERIERWKAAAAQPMLLDFVLALVLAGTVLKATLTNATDQLTAWDLSISLVAFVAVLARRSHPYMALAVATVSTTGAVATEVRNPGLIVALGVITYSISAHGGRRQGLFCAFAASSVVYVTVGILNHDSWLRADVLGIYAWVFLAAAVGDAARSHRAYVVEVEERARRAEQTRDEEARRRVAEERLRIARELHDVVAHHIAVINVQAGAAGHILARRPEEVGPVLAHIREASDSVLAEIQSVVGVLRGGDEPDTTEPVPHLGRLPELLAGLRAAGFPVAYRLRGTPRTLPAVVDLAAYRIAQEALTNAHKHGAGGAELVLEHTPAGVVVEVRNALRAVPGDQSGGYGLLGMHERAASAGGTVTAGVTDEHQFRVHAVLPVEPATAAVCPLPRWGRVQPT